MKSACVFFSGITLLPSSKPAPLSPGSVCALLVHGIQNSSNVFARLFNTLTLPHGVEACGIREEQGLPVRGQHRLRPVHAAEPVLRSKQVTDGVPGFHRDRLLEYETVGI